MNSAQLWFWGLIAVLTLLALGFALWPLLRSRSTPDVSRKHLNVAIYRELSQPGAAEYLDADEATRRLVQDAEGSTPATPAREPRRLLWILVLALLLPLLALFSYLPTDSWRLVGSSREQPPIEYLLSRLRERVAANPQDADGHLLLARAYSALERRAEALESYTRANTLRSDPDADALAEEAELRAQLAGGDFRGAPAELLTRALAADRKHQKSLWYMGLIAYSAGDRAQALDYWQRLASQPLPQDFRRLLAQKISELGAKPAEPPATAAIKLRLRVSLNSKLAENPPKEAAVFVFARAEQGGRPLAVLRRSAAELPFEAELTEANSMAGGPALSDFDRWRVVARVSRSGQPLAQPGDWFGERAVTRDELRKGLIDIVIDQVQP